MSGTSTTRGAMIPRSDSAWTNCRVSVFAVVVLYQPTTEPTCPPTVINAVPAR